MDRNQHWVPVRVSISSVMAALCSPKASVKVRVLGGTPKFSNADVAKLVNAAVLEAVS